MEDGVKSVASFSNKVNVEFFMNTPDLWYSCTAMIGDPATEIPETSNGGVALESGNFFCSVSGLNSSTQYKIKIQSDINEPFPRQTVTTLDAPSDTFTQILSLSTEIDVAFNALDGFYSCSADIPDGLQGTLFAATQTSPEFFVCSISGLIQDTDYNVNISGDVSFGQAVRTLQIPPPENIPLDTYTYIVTDYQEIDFAFNVSNSNYSCTALNSDTTITVIADQTDPTSYSCSFTDLVPGFIYSLSVYRYGTESIFSFETSTVPEFIGPPEAVSSNSTEIVFQYVAFNEPLFGQSATCYAVNGEIFTVAPTYEAGNIVCNFSGLGPDTDYACRIEDTKTGAVTDVFTMGTTILEQDPQFPDDPVPIFSNSSEIVFQLFMSSSFLMSVGDIVCKAFNIKTGEYSVAPSYDLSAESITCSFSFLPFDTYDVYVTDTANEVESDRVGVGLFQCFDSAPLLPVLNYSLSSFTSWSSDVGNIQALSGDAPEFGFVLETYNLGDLIEDFPDRTVNDGSITLAYDELLQYTIRSYASNSCGATFSDRKSFSNVRVTGTFSSITYFFSNTEGFSYSVDVSDIAGNPTFTYINNLGITDLPFTLTVVDNSITNWLSFSAFNYSYDSRRILAFNSANSVLSSTFRKFVFPVTTSSLSATTMIIVVVLALLFGLLFAFT